jgi:hypothetical protein
MNRLTAGLKSVYLKKDWLWTIIWLSGICGLWIWNLIFLNNPALQQIKTGFLNTLAIALMVIILAALLGWSVTLLNHWLTRKFTHLQMILTFFINLIRSIPQIVGILIGFVVLAALIRNQIIHSNPLILFIMAWIIAFFVFLEIFDLLQERIAHFRRLDFYDAMRVCGISERFIINREIIWRSSLMHMINKLIAVFGAAIFLLCSVDFIISVGLSTDVSSVDLPVTLGSLLAKIDSKQDILAIGYSLTNWDYARYLPFTHLQGISIAFIIVFTLLCIFQIANGYGGRRRL